MALPFELQRNVSREEINELPIRRYEGEVHVVATAHDLAPAMADILRETVVGFDTETRPSFRVGESYPPSLAQVATVIAEHDGNIDNISMSRRSPDFTELTIDLEVYDLKHLSAIIAQLRAKAVVAKVERVNG